MKNIFLWMLLIICGVILGLLMSIYTINVHINNTLDASKYDVNKDGVVSLTDLVALKEELIRLGEEK